MEPLGLSIACLMYSRGLKPQHCGEVNDQDLEYLYEAPGFLEMFKLSSVQTRGALGISGSELEYLEYQASLNKP